MKKRVKRIALLTAASLFFTSAPVPCLTPCSTVAQAANKTVSESLSLSEDMTIVGDLTITEGGRIELNNHTLTVTGTVYQRAGLLNIGTGTMKIKGDYICSGPNSSVGTGELYIYNDDAMLDVDGSVIFRSSAPTWQSGSSTLRIGGDLSVYNDKCYNPGGSHVTEFKGNVIHTVSFSETVNNHLNRVSVTGGGKLFLTGKTTGFTLDSDVTLSTGSQITSGRNLDLNEHTLTVTGDFTQTSESEDNAFSNIYVGTGSMQVNGTYYHRSGQLNVGTGTVHITGDYICSGPNSNVGDGELYIYNDNGLLDVDGSVIFRSSAPTWQSGSSTLRIGGDLSVYNDKCYNPGGSHVTEFKGDVIHTVSFSETSNNHLNRVSVTGGGKLFLTGKTTGFTLDSDVTLSTGSQITSGRNLDLNEHTLTVTGDFTQTSENEDNAFSNIYVGTGSMQVNGTYYHRSGQLNVGTGTVHITGDYICSGPNSSVGDGELYIYHDDAMLDVDGSVIFRSKASTWQSGSSTLRIGGDLSVYNDKCYSPGGSHVTEFKGDVIHTVSFSETSNNHLNYVSVTDGGKLFLTGKTSGFTMNSDVTLSTESQITSGRNLDLNGHTLTVTGDFTQTSENEDNAFSNIYIGKGTMQVNGTYYHRSGQLNTGTGTVKIGGNYISSGFNSSIGAGELYIYHDDALMDVDGDVLFRTNSALWQSGLSTLRIGGDLSVYSIDGGRGYAPGGSHITEFKGGTTHQAYFSNEKNYTNTIQLGIGDSLTFAGDGLNGIKKDNSSSLSIEDSSIASISDMTITGIKEGKSTLTFKNADTSTTKTLIVGKTNTTTLPSSAPSASAKPSAAPGSTPGTTLPGTDPTATTAPGSTPGTTLPGTDPTATAAPGDSSGSGTAAPGTNPAASPSPSGNIGNPSDNANVIEIETGIPGKPSTTITAQKGGKITIKIKPVRNASGYQIQYSTKKSFKKSATKTALTKKTLYTITKLKKKKTYYIRARAYRQKGPKKRFGKWGKVVKVKAR